MDQAVTLRSIAESKGEYMQTGVQTRVIAVSSGKGGVGKTNSVVNLAVAFAEMGERVLLLDADLGLGNLDVLLGLAPKYNPATSWGREDHRRGDGRAGIMILPAAQVTGDGPVGEERLSLASHLRTWRPSST
jgi:flagellar biosynthesis protein FlhG